MESSEQAEIQARTILNSKTDDTTLTDASDNESEDVEESEHESTQKTSEIHPDEPDEIEAENSLSIESEDEPCKLSCSKDWILFIYSLERYRFYQPIDLGEIGKFNLKLESPEYLGKNHKNEHSISLTKKNENSSYLKVIVNEFGELKKFILQGKEMPYTSLSSLPENIYAILNGCFMKAVENVVRVDSSNTSLSVTTP
ncbi:MAG: hypothetical protein HWD61_04075 [Parachlamydiaceae bacterium]|nr:MAG: hypothetical protein HWD61_04075 [Parachlamydiaceae bacterium]